MRLKLFLLPVLIFLSSLNLKATHIVGGELNYKYLGNWDYEIRLTVYRDCWVGVPPFDNPASLGAFDINNNLIYQFSLTFLGLDTLPPTISDPCFIPPTDFCYEVTTYIDTINLPPIPGGYQLVYQRCCRNQNILNIQLPQNTGATYYATIPDTSVVTINSNPVFTNWPPPFICAGKLLSFDHSATDIDGDSLVYELFNPFEGANTGNPMPVPPNNPPYLNVIYIPPYSVNDMLGGPLPMNVNSVTGLLTAIPNTLGYFVIGVKCKEYRNGVFISETKRDFQFIVKDCPSLAAAAATVPNVICGTNQVTFTNASDSTISNIYFWNFGDPTTLADTSHIKTPNYLYPDTGTYNYYLVAYATANPACNDTFFSAVTFSDNFNGTYSFFTEPCLNNIMHFTATVNAPSSTSPVFTWDFGDGTQISGTGTSNITSPINTTGTYSFPIHTYPTGSGTYQIILSTGIPGSVNCYDTISAQSINISTSGEFYVPNTFTPNNDGKNDVFRVRGPFYKDFYFAVYNRWGQLLFETTDPSVGWDGMFNGMPSDPGVFGYYVKASCGGDTQTIFKKGNVTLIR